MAPENTAPSEDEQRPRTPNTQAAPQNQPAQQPAQPQTAPAAQQAPTTEQQQNVRQTSEGLTFIENAEINEQTKVTIANILRFTRAKLQSILEDIVNSSPDIANRLVDKNTSLFKRDAFGERFELKMSADIHDNLSVETITSIKRDIVKAARAIIAIEPSKKQEVLEAATPTTANRTSYQNAYNASRPQQTTPAARPTQETNIPATTEVEQTSASAQNSANFLTRWSNRYERMLKTVESFADNYLSWIVPKRMQQFFGIQPRTSQTDSTNE